MNAQHYSPTAARGRNCGGGVSPPDGRPKVAPTAAGRRSYDTFRRRPVVDTHRTGFRKEPHALPLSVLIVCGVVLTAATALAQSGPVSPHLGYLYPAGAPRGTTVKVTVGGQFLRGLDKAHVSGEGLEASVVRYVGMFMLDGDQRKELGRRLATNLLKEWTALETKGHKVPEMAKRWLKRMARDAEKGGDGDPVELPAHPLIEGLENMSLRELLHVRNELLSYKGKKQQNAQIGEIAVIEIKVAPDARAGDREIRLGSRLGLSNPMIFQVGDSVETREREPNDPMPDDGVPRPESFLPVLPPVKLPALLNGQVMPGDVDRLRFAAKKGQRLVIETQARRLVPYLADAVPGWFQPVVTLYDEQGEELACADDYRFSVDPVLLFEVPRDGTYVLEIRDAIYRGREDFVYRISISEKPFVTSMFPLGGREGEATSVSIAGWNLPRSTVSLDTSAPGRHEFVIEGPGRDGRSNPVFFRVGTLPETHEAGPNNDKAHAQRVALPAIVNGRIEEPGDVDVFSITGNAGDRVVAEIDARRLGSPLDSLLRLTDESGEVIAWNDDFMEKDGHLHAGPGLLTHHADSYLAAELPRKGTYTIHVADTCQHGGAAYAYRLRISPPQPDFHLRVTPASLAVRGALAAEITVYADRKDGFDGPINVVLKDAPRGLVLHGGRIPAGRKAMRMTVSASGRQAGQPLTLQVEGRARIDGRTVVREASAAENQMQAFLWRHLVPADDLVVRVDGKLRPRRPFGAVDEGRVSIPAGGSVQLSVRVPSHPKARPFSWRLDDPPAGIALESTEVTKPGLLSLTLSADAEVVEPGFCDNLIVVGYMERGGNKEGGAGKRQIRVGVLPAIPARVAP